MGTLTDNYQIIKELGRGGMGAVFLATDKRLDRKVAIKVLQLNNNFTLQQKSEIIARFQKEAKAIAKLSHSNVVGIHDIGEDNSQHYMVMEFLEGKSIGNMLEDEGKLPIDECVDISIQMCKALSYIHKNSIVHRDIKPDNILIIKDKLVKLTDFGIAQNDTEALRLTQDGAILGSVMYISPEQLKNSRDVDNRADIYSFGVTLYQMLTGKLPFNGETVGEVVAKILSENPELPRKLNPSIPYELEAIVMKAMNKDREKRYKSAEDMERDLQNLAAGQSFKKTTISNTKINPAISNTSTNISKNTTINNTKTNIVVEKASSQTKLIRTVLKLVISIIAIYVTYNLFFDFVSQSVAEGMLPKFNGAMIQGPYSQYLVDSKIAIQSGFYSLIAVLFILIFSAYSFPIESKGIHRNFNIKSEISPALIVFVISVLYTFVFVAKPNPLNEYNDAFAKDNNSEITNLDSILKEKGQLNYSEIDNYKKKFRLLLNKKAIATVYSDMATQIKDNVIQGDHIKLNVSTANKVSDPEITTINDLVNNVFSFNDPSKEIYTSKVNQLLSVVSEGTLTSLPENATYKVTRDGSSNKVNSVTFEWDKNNLVIKENSATAKIDDKDYTYPKPSEKLSSIYIENDTDKPILFLFYSLGDSGKLENSLSIDSGKKEEIKSRTDRERMAVVLFKDKTAIPMSVTQNFSDGDTIKVDKIYYDTNDYYSVNQRTFPGKQDTKSTKVDLKSQNLFFTNDADIVSYNLTSPKKN